LEASRIILLLAQLVLVVLRIGSLVGNGASKISWVEDLINIEGTVHLLWAYCGIAKIVGGTVASCRAVILRGARIIGSVVRIGLVRVG
jgi:hypothetical protein